MGLPGGLLNKLVVSKNVSFLTSAPFSLVAPSRMFGRFWFRTVTWYREQIFFFYVTATSFPLIKSIRQFIWEF